MDRSRAAVAAATQWASRFRPTRSGQGLPHPPPDTTAGERGQGLAEYALILGLIAIVAIAALVFLGGSISEMFFDPISKDFGAVLSRIFAEFGG